MKNRAMFTRVLLLVGAVSVLAGCDDHDLFEKAPGTYVGYTNTGEVAKAVQRPATVKIVKKSKRELSVEVVDAAAKHQLSVRAENDKTLVVRLDGDAKGEQTLKSATPECFETKGPRPVAQLCFNSVELTLQVPAFSVLARRATGHKPPPLEKPRQYSLAELLQRTANQAFDTRVAFERTLQSRLTARTSYLNLLPHVSYGTVFGLASSFTILSAARAIGDLVPFLIPTRWLQAFEAQHQSKADAYAFVLMKADAVNVSEGLAYSLLRDQAIVERYEAHRLRIADLRDDILAREQMGLMRQGASQDIDSIVITLAKAVTALNDIVVQERSALAQSTGFFNPQAIEGVELATGPMDQLNDLPAEDELRRIAFDHAYELQQMDELIAAAKLNRFERYISWLDPSPPSGGAFGAALIPYIQVGYSHVRELEARRDGTESALLEKLTFALSGYRQAVEAQKLATESVALQEKRVERLREWMAMGISFPTADLVNALQDQVKADIDLVTTEFAFAIMRSKLNRAIYAGPYAGLTFRRP